MSRFRSKRAPWGVDRRPKPSHFTGTCEGLCTRTCLVQWRPAQTCYPWDGEGENPNRSLCLCDECWAEYKEYWDDMWADYYAGRL